MPSRTLWNGILDCRRLGRLSEGSQLLYYKLLSLVDDRGCYQADPELIAIKAFPWTSANYAPEDIECRLQELASGHEPILTFDHVDGERIIELHDIRRGYISEVLRQEVLAAGKCVYCGSPDSLEVDHVIPVVRGGKSNRENLQPLCKPCNRTKGRR